MTTLLIYLFTDLLVDFCQLIINVLSAFGVGSFLSFQPVALRLKLFTFSTDQFLHNHIMPASSRSI